MRVGIVILPELPWAQSGPLWRAAEQMGFDHAWTYDHLVWGGLPESPWYGALPVLTAAAATTSTIGLGTWVASPNFRHPVSLWREVQALDDVSAGRFRLAVGTGGDVDSRLLGGEPLSVRERVDRFSEFVALLVRMRQEDHVDADGTWFCARDARTLPRVTSVPLLVAATGPRSLRVAARSGDGWVTTGRGGDTVDEWFAGLTAVRDGFDAALEAAGRAGADLPRLLSIDAGPVFALSGADLFEDLVGRAGELGFTDVVTHWPRPDGPYAGTRAVLEEVASRLPRLRG